MTGHPREQRRAQRRARPAALVLTLAAACTGVCGEGHVAELVEASGAVDRDTADAVGSWVDAAPGDRFAYGDGIRTGTAAGAMVRLRGGGRAQLEADTVVRFLRAPPSAGDPEATRLSLETGEATLEHAGGDDAPALYTDLRIGLARIERGGRVRLVADEDGVRLTVELGLAQVERDGAPPLAVRADETVAVDVDAAVIERVTEEAAADEADPPPAPTPEAPATTGPVRVRVDGRGARIRRPGDRRFAPLSDGDETEVPEGSRLQGRRRTRLELARGDERAVLDGPGEIVVGGPDGALAEVVRGRASLAAGGGDLEVTVPGGSIVLKGGVGTRADLDIDRTGTSARVTEGQAEVRADDGPRAQLTAGQSARLDRRGSLDAPEPPPARYHVALPAGESATVHDPAGPPSVRITFEETCPGRGLVEVARGTSYELPRMASPGTGAANIRLGAGATRYRVRCDDGDGGFDDEPAASGRVVFRRDSGAADFPNRPPRNVLDADGLRYTVLYQTLLPELLIRWRDPPPGASGPWVLHLDGGGRGERTYRSPTPEQELDSGQVRDGRYRFWFEGAGDTKSKTSSLRVGFDNATPSAYIRAPPAGSPLTGAEAQVSGAALSGARVTVGARSLALDGQRRFAATVPIPQGPDALAVRIAHPRTGIDYYLRRRAVAPDD